MTNGNTAEAQRIIYLVSGYIGKQLTVQEMAELEQWIAEAPANRQLFEQLTDESYRNSILAQWKPETAENSLQNLKSKIAQQKKQVLWPRIAVAASIILALSFGGYYIFRKQPVQQIAQIQQHDIAPGHNQATLTLANGKKITLTKGLNGRLAQQGNTVIQINAGVAIAYTSSATETKVEYNTLSTVRGEQSPYPLILADGSKVWLDAASSITFPTAFNGSDRIVKITGQAYFEIAHRATQPFKVEVKGQTIQDIGTKFNVNAYEDEPFIRTTLLEGSIRVAKNKQAIVLIPGQEAVTQVSTAVININNTNTEEAVAWKNGVFRFESIELKELMRQVSRWYSVDVVYQGQVPHHEFFIDVKRKTNLSNILKILEEGGVHFKIIERTLTVTP